MVSFTPGVFAGALGFASAAMFFLLIGLLLRANFRSYRLFGYDKAQAEACGQRVPELELLRAARRGGWIGAKLAQRRFRHKTRKEAFRSNLNRIGKRQAALLAVLGLAAILVPPLPQIDVLAFAMGAQQVMAPSDPQAAPVTFAPDRSLFPVPRPKPPKS